MRASLVQIARAATIGLIVVACSPVASPIPSTSPSPSGASSPPASESPRASTQPSAAPSASPWLAPLPQPATLPLRRSADESGERVLMAPGPRGVLFVSIPTPTGSILALLGADGKPRPGWPIAIEDSCSLLMAHGDGTLRAVCDPPGFEPPQDVHAYAFTRGGRPLAGWPVQLGSDLQYTGRMVRNDLVLVAGRYDSVSKASMLAIGPDGAIRRGADASHECCYGWTISSDGISNDGIAYGHLPRAESPHDSRLTAVDFNGELEGWPVQVEGPVSNPASTSDGRIVVAVALFANDAGRLLAFGQSGIAAQATSPDLPITLARPEQGDVDCGPSSIPPAPITAGSTFVYSELDDAVFSLNPFLAINEGWPFHPATRLEDRYYQGPGDGISCSSLARPAAGPPDVLYMPLQARNETVGGNLVAVDRNGQVVPGWPIELKRPGAEFWSVVVGVDETVYALALEPESGNTWSSSILAIAPDSTVRYTTTIVGP